MAYDREEVINYAPGGDSVKIGIEKLDTDLTGVFTHLNTINADLTNHAADTSTHGVGSIVGVDEAQTLTNKTISLANNTVSGTLAQFNAAVSDADLLDTATAASTYIAMSSFDGDKGDISVSGSGSDWTVKSVAGNLSFTGTGARIRGDFSAATIADRTMFQTSVANSQTVIETIPNGTIPTGAQVGAFNIGDGDVVNGNLAQMVLLKSTEVRFSASARGSGTYLPMTFHTGGYERMRIDTSGNVTLSSAAGLGYGAGAGGTVTQATSKSTAVTLNKPTGQITMNNAALAAGASVIFIFYNSLFTIFDTLIVNQSWGAAENNSYRVEVTGCGAGAAKIRVTNITGGSLSEALLLNYTLIKGATS